MAIQVHSRSRVFLGQWKGDDGVIMLALSLSFWRNSERKYWKLPFSTSPLSFDAPSPGNPSEHPNKTYIVRNNRHCATSSPPIVQDYLHSNFRGELRIRLYFETCVMAVQAHLRSLILAPIESSYATSYWLSVVILLVCYSVSEILQVFCWKQRLPPLFDPNFGVSPLY